MTGGSDVMKFLALSCALLMGCSTVDTDQSASLCVGLCVEVKSKLIKGKHNAPTKLNSSRDTDRRDG